MLKVRKVKSQWKVRILSRGCESQWEPLYLITWPQEWLREPSALQEKDKWVGKGVKWDSCERYQIRFTLLIRSSFWCSCFQQIFGIQCLTACFTASLHQITLSIIINHVKNPSHKYFPDVNEPIIWILAEPRRKIWRSRDIQDRNIVVVTRMWTL